MLKTLLVSNYAIIDEILLEFEEGFNVITGETGAGKSILLGALGLIIGDRADTKVLYDESRKCIVEAKFLLSKKSLESLPASEEYDLDLEIMLRREINSAGKSRAFVNDTPVRLGSLKELASKLVDIHNQFDTLSITSEEYQREILDAYAQNQNVKTEYSSIYHQWLAAKSELAKLIAAKNSLQKDHDYYLFQLNELEKINLDNIDLEEIENEYHTLENAEGIGELTRKMSDLLINNDFSIESNLIDINKQLNKYASINPELTRLNDNIEELLELTRSTDKLALLIQDNLDTSEERLGELRELIDEIYRLQKKHNLPEIKDLLSLRDDLRMKTEGKENLDQHIAGKQKSVDSLQKSLIKIGQELTTTRKNVSASFAASIGKNLNELAIPNGLVSFQIDATNNFTEYGMDAIQLLFSANKGIAPQLVGSAASGGELSRLALSVKSIVANKIDVPTLLFDEIDTGISGSVALKLGQILYGISTERQVITITHSPQVASIKGRHFNVSKVDKKDRTVTSVTHLSSDARIIEIAKMLSADPPSESALKNAQELLAMH